VPNISRDIIVVGASAGGVEALQLLTANLPVDLGASVIVVLHMPVGGPSALPAILRRSCRLPVVPAENGIQLEHGHVYVAVPNRHLLVVDGALRLSLGPTESGHRPSIDALFRSAARAAGPRVIGVVLSGALDDGTAGLTSITARGGAAVIQDPADALYPGMAENALRAVKTEFVVTAQEMGTVLTKLVSRQVEVSEVPPLDPSTTVEADIAERGEWEVDDQMRSIATPSGFSCPDCEGSLLELPDTNRYRCRVGHAWSANALAAQKDSELERALWKALRTLDEKASLTRRLRTTALARGSALVAARYQGAIEEAEHAANVLRTFLHAEAVIGESGS